MPEPKINPEEWGLEELVKHIYRQQREMADSIERLNQILQGMREDRSITIINERVAKLEHEQETDNLNRYELKDMSKQLNSLKERVSLIEEGKKNWKTTVAQLSGVAGAIYAIINIVLSFVK